MVEYRMITQTNCMGCGGCAAMCPKCAIEIKRDEDGFYKPYINLSLCVECGLCDHICPQNDSESFDADAAYSYKSASSAVLKRSASGGFGFDVSSELVSAIPVCSALYDPHIASPKHTVSYSNDDLSEKQNSFYLQSYTVDGLKEIIKIKKGVFLGTPCQVAALDRILKLKGTRDQYVLIDFFCHGVPSYLVWERYLDGISNDHEAICNVKFRSKKYRWGRFTIELNKGAETLYSDSVVDKDVFYTIFLEAMATNEPCYSCRYHSENSRADIRMGDFWGDRQKTDTDGVSALLVYTDKGAEVLQRLQQRGCIETVEKDEILRGQIVNDLPVPACRTAVLKQLRAGKSLDAINKTVIFNYKLKRKIYRMIGRQYV